MSRKSLEPFGGSRISNLGSAKGYWGLGGRWGRLSSTCKPCRILKVCGDLSGSILNDRGRGVRHLPGKERGAREVCNPSYLSLPPRVCDLTKVEKHPSRCQNIDFLSRQ